MAYKVTGLSINREAGTDGSYYAIWTCTKDHIDSFQITWKYSTGNKRKVTKTKNNKKQTTTETVWFVGSSTTEKNKSATNVYTSSYNPPENAVAIKVFVKPISTKYETTVNKQKVTKSYWSADFNNATYTIPKPKLVVATPSVPSLTVDKYKLTASITNIPLDSNIKQVQFQFWRYNSKVLTSNINVSKSRVANAYYTVKVPGSGYKVRARGVNGNNYSAWSEFCDPVQTIPETPKVIKTITRSGTTQLNLNWDNCKGVSSEDGYTVQYTTRKEYFDSGTDVTSVNVNESAAQITGLQPGTVYFFRIKANNNTGSTSWSAIKDSNTTMSSSEVSNVSTPIVTINSKNELTAKVESLADDIDLVTFYIRRRQQKKNTDQYEWVSEKTISNVKPSALRVASIKYTVGKRTDYQVRARGINQYKNAAKKTVNAYGAWSGYCDSVKTLPEQPAKKGVSPDSNNKKNSPFMKIYTRGLDSPNSNTMEVALSWHKMEAASSYDLEYATELRDFYANRDVVTTLPDLTSRFKDINGLEAGKVYYFRIRAKNNTGATGWSCDSTTDYKKGYVSIKVGTKPSPPTTWSSTTTAIVGDRVTLYWLHNSEDGSADRYGQIGLRENNGAWRYVDITNSENTDNNLSNDEIKTRSYQLDTSDYEDGATVEWRVRTKGVIDTWSDFSIIRKITVHARPTVVLSLTDAQGEDLNTGEDTTIITSFPFYLTAETGPSSQTPISYHVSVISNDSYNALDNIGNPIVIGVGDEVYSKSFDTVEDLILEFSANNIDLQDGVVYTINCTASMNSGLTAEAEMPFTINWTDVFYDLNAEIVINNYDYSASIKPVCFNEDETEITEGVMLAVYRREYDGRFTEIQSNIMCGEDTFVVDPHPSLDYARYRIVGTDISTGAISYTDLPGEPIGAVEAVFQWDEAWSDFNAGEEIDEEIEEEPKTGSMIKLPYNIDVSDNNNPDVSLVNYIGRQHPVSYYGTQLGSSSSWKVDIPKDDTDTLYALRRLAIWMGDVYVREPSGSGYWAHVNVSFSQTHCDVIIPVNFNITRVEGGI